MRRLLKKGTKWEWTEEQNTNFNKIKRELTSQPCLAHYIEKKYCSENEEAEKNYEEEFVINAIAQLATVNYRIERIFNQ